MLQLDSLVFANPHCSYSSESLFGHLIYIPSQQKHIPCLYLACNNKANERGKMLLYFHGNAEDLGITFGYLKIIRECLGTSIIAMEYRGYGIYNDDKSSDGLLIDALSVYDFVN
jgi:hypothetical protein